MKSLKLIVSILFKVSIIFIIVSCKDPVPPHEHSFSTEWSKDETHHWHAATCEHTSEVDSKAEHSFGEWVEIEAATEESMGSKKKTCTVCGYEVVKAIAKLEHIHTFSSEWAKDEDYHWYDATCGHEVEKDKASHTFGNWIVTKEATEETEGSQKKSCTVCGYEVTEVIASLAHTHTYANAWTKDKNYHWHSSTCGHEVEKDKSSHTFGNWTITKEATEETEGSQKKSCTVCGYEVTEAIAKLPHTHKFSNKWSKNSTHHWHVATCEHSSEISDMSEHSFNNKICVCGLPEGFAIITSGTFQMGSNKGANSNKPVHEVSITKNFYMGKYEVTQAEWQSVMGNNPSKFQGENFLPTEGEVQTNRPVEQVSWYRTLVYCNKRSLSEGLNPCYFIDGTTDTSKWGDVPSSNSEKWNNVECDFNANGYRLPTEAEWEYAARAGDNSIDSLIYSGSSNVNSLGDYSWYDDNSQSKTHEVGKKKPNAFGLYDMSGNVFEWCWNLFSSKYDTTAEGGSDPTGVTSGAYRISRGGCYSSNSDENMVSNRTNYKFPSFYLGNIGFRVVRSCSE